MARLQDRSSLMSKEICNADDQNAHFEERQASRVQASAAADSGEEEGLDYDAFSGFARGASVGRGKYVMAGSTKEYQPESAGRGFGRQIEVLKLTGKDSPRSLGMYHRKSNVGNKIDAFTRNLLGPGGKKVK
jgi:hypothetical protein